MPRDVRLASCGLFAVQKALPLVPRSNGLIPQGQPTTGLPNKQTNKHDDCSASVLPFHACQTLRFV